MEGAIHYYILFTLRIKPTLKKMLQKHKSAWMGRGTVKSLLLLVFVFPMPTKSVTRRYVDWISKLWRLVTPSFTYGGGGGVSPTERLGAGS